MSDSHSHEAAPFDDRIITLEPTVAADLVRYTRQWFAPEDEVLQRVRERARREDLPLVELRPEEGQLLGFLARMIGARTAVEVGTLVGYSGIWLARALPDDGKLITLERNPLHATMARQHFRWAGVADRVEVLEGEAADLLRGNLADTTVDMVFLDADKEGFPLYLAWAIEHVRPGGLITAHNAFRSGRLLRDEPDANDLATRAFLESLATHPRLQGTIVPVGDGLAAAIVR